VISLLTILIVGFFLGMRHATDPDHVIAVSTIVTRQKGIAQAGIVGALWGLGHTFTIFVVGAAIILFKVAIPPRLGLSMEFAVGLMLILLGVLNLTGILGSLQQGLTLRAGVLGINPSSECSGTSSPRESCLTTDQWQNSAEQLPKRDKIFPSFGFYNVFRPIVIGIIHGLAGSAAVALLVMATIANPWWATAYLLLFGVGTIAGMMLITSFITVTLTYSTQRFSFWNRSISVASGLLSMGFGIFISYKMGIVYGLFTNHPQWAPR
jgi:hypothetical protein